MKNMKKKLFAATAMLLVSAVMLGSSTFAWYTLSTAPEISKISAKVASNENLEIALDNGYEAGETSTEVTNSVDAASKFNDTSAGGSTTGNYYTWGNLIDVTHAFGVINNTGNSTQLLLAPVKYNNGTIQYPVYGKDGRMSALEDTTVMGICNDDDEYKPGTTGVAVYKKDDDSTNYDAFSLTYWLRSNEKAKVSLSDVVERAATANDDATQDNDVNKIKGAGSYVAFNLNGYKDGSTVKDKAGNDEFAENLTKVKELAKHLVIQFVEYKTVNGTTTPETIGYANINGTIEEVKNEDQKVTGIKYKLKLMKEKNTYVKPTNGTDNAAATIELEANVGKKITMLVYLDGETLTNANALVEDMGMEMNIQFTSNAIDSTMAMDGATDTDKPGTAAAHNFNPGT